MDDPNGSGATCKHHSAHDAILKDHTGRLDKHDRQIDELQTRVRPWVVWVMTGCGFIIGSLSTFIGTSIIQ